MAEAADNSRGRRPARRSRRWGFADENRFPPDAVAIGSVIQSVVKKRNLSGSMWQHQLEMEWGVVVGAAIAKHARPGLFENGLLTIFVDSSVWLNELKRYSADLLLTKIRQRFSEVKQLRFQADPEAAKKT